MHLANLFAYVQLIHKLRVSHARNDEDVVFKFWQRVGAAKAGSIFRPCKRMFIVEASHTLRILCYIPFAVCHKYPGKDGIH